METNGKLVVEWNGKKEVGMGLKPMMQNTLIAGVGGAGSIYAERLFQDIGNMGNGFEKVSCLLIDTDKKALHKKTADHMQIGERVLDGNGTGADQEKGRVAAEESLGEILDHTKETERVILLFGAGGGTGGGASTVLLNAFKEQGKEVIAIAFTPYTFEAPNVLDNAERMKREIEKHPINAFLIDNDFIYGLDEVRRMTKKQVEDYVYEEVVKKLVDSTVTGMPVEWLKS